MPSALFLHVTMKTMSFAHGHRGLCLVECTPLAPSLVNTVLAPSLHGVFLTGQETVLASSIARHLEHVTPRERTCAVFQRLSSVLKKDKFIRGPVVSAGELQAGMVPDLWLSEWSLSTALGRCRGEHPGHR